PVDREAPPPAREGAGRRTRAGRAVGDVHLEERALGRARGLRHVRHSLRRTSGPASHPHVPRVPGASAAQGLPAESAMVARARARSADAAVVSTHGRTVGMRVPGSTAPEQFYENQRGDDEIMEIQMGPSHPASHGTVKFNLKLDGETIVEVDVEVGYLHRGFEKMCEQGTWNHCFPYADRLHYASPLPTT